VSRARTRLVALGAAGLALLPVTALTPANTLTAYAAPSPSSVSLSPSPGQTSGQTGSQGGRTEQGPAAIAISSLTPAVVTPTSTLVITGTVTNTGPTAIQNGVIRLLVHHAPLATRDQVGQWASGGISDVGGRILDASMDLSVTVRPGATIAFTLRAPASRLGLFMEFASIGITLEALGDDNTGLGTHRVGLLRTFLTWQQNPSYSPLKLTWLMPLTGGPTSALGGPPDAVSLAAGVSDGSRLRNLLSAIAAAPVGAALTVAVDPSLIADLRLRAGQPAPATSPASPTSSRATATGGASGTPTASGTSPTGPNAANAPQASAAYLAALKTALIGRRVIPLPYGDPDLMGVADAKGTALLTAASTASSAATAVLTDELGTRFIPDVAWPAGGQADNATIGAAGKVGARTLVLAASSRPPTLQQSTTPTGLTPLTDTTNAVLSDDQLSTLLSRTNNPANQVLNTQRFLAETLATVYESPDRQRTLLVTAPRSYNPNPAVVQQFFAAIGSAQWIARATMTQLRNAQGQATVTDRQVVPVPANTRRVQVTAGQVSEVRDARTSAAQLGQVVTGDDPFTRIRVDALRLLSTTWRGRAGTAALRTKALRAYLDGQAAKVHILPLSNLNFLASDGNLTLSVANDLAQQVKGIRVEVQPGNGRLVVVRQAPSITVEADRRTTIKVHVKAVAGGIVPVTARILTPDGLQMGKTVTVRVHVRPTDTWAFWVLGIAVGLIFVIGLMRTLRRGRARPRLMAPEVEDL
jgi:hypothetical protein